MSKIAMIEQQIIMTDMQMTGTLIADFVYDTNQRGASYCDSKGICTDDIIYISASLPKGSQVTGKVSSQTVIDANGSTIKQYFLTISPQDALGGKVNIPFSELSFPNAPMQSEDNDRRLWLLAGLFFLGIILLSDD